MPRKNLTDRMIKALKPAALGTRSEHWDAIVPGLGIRVTDRLHAVVRPRERRHSRGGAGRLNGEEPKFNPANGGAADCKWLVSQHLCLQHL
jgi:hypothetical protein